MIRTAEQKHVVTREARIWHEKLRRGLIRRLSLEIELPASKGGR